MIESDYYRDYKGPELSKATLNNEDITDLIKTFYGDNNWQGKLWTYEDIFESKKGQFYIEFKSEEGRIHWFYGFIDDKTQYFNPPLV
jgi:hypothetical protein